MKKLISIVAVVGVLAVMLTACGKFTCDMCGQEKSGKKHTSSLLGQEVVYCDDCNDSLNSLGGLLG